MMKQVRHIWNSGMSRKGIVGLFSAVTASLMLSSSVTSLHARPKAAGITFSYTGISLCYEHEIGKDRSYLDLSLKSEFSEYTLGRSEYPGISTSITWNSMLRQWTTSEGNIISIFVGPGVTAGYGKDFPESAKSGTSTGSYDGVFFGIMGRAVVECRFSRNVNLTAGISPIIGSHIVYNNGLMSMKWYRNGLYYALVPEIGIKYRF